MATEAEVIFFDAIGRNDVAVVGGKNASLGEMVCALDAEGIRVPPGFATTSDAFRAFIKANNLNRHAVWADGGRRHHGFPP